jgi:hypothetical protein
MSWKRFIAGGDVHGDQQCPESNDVFFKFCDIWKPHIRICAGDVYDLRPLRHGASEDERHESMVADFTAGTAWLKRFRPDYFLLGNHDARLWELRDHGKGVEADYAARGCSEIETLCDRMRCKMLPYDVRDGILKIGHAKFLHGFYTGMYAARQHAATFGSCMFWHVHYNDEHSIPGLERRVGRACAALCKLNMKYLQRKPGSLKHANGFAYGIINDKTGDYFSWVAESIGGAWMLPNDICQVKTGLKS